VEGASFRFGRGRAGGVETLRRAGASGGFELHLTDPVRIPLGGGEEVVSSTLIRRLVAAGRVADAARCLGRDFCLYGRVVPGSGLGRSLEYPTANLALGEQVCPGDGVYAGRAAVAGAEFAAAISIGTKPTFPETRQAGPTVEAFLLDASGDYYGQTMALSFARRLRDQRRYEGPEALKAQMARDVETVRRIVPGKGQ
jgi:riboflavin kinase/FMN adenylyltransferase